MGEDDVFDNGKGFTIQLELLTYVTGATNVLELSVCHEVHTFFVKFTTFLIK